MDKLDFISLPIDVLVNIIKNLSYSDVLNVMLTCKYLNILIRDDNVLWRLISSKYLIIQRDPFNIFSFNWYNKCRISSNWIKGIYRNKIILLHSMKYMPWLCLQDECFFLTVGPQLWCFGTNRLGMPECSVCYWRLTLPRTVRHDVRTNDISRFKVRDSYVACGNRDGCVTVFKYDNVKRRPNLQYKANDCHLNGKVEVTAVELITRDDNCTIISGSNNEPCLKMWKPPDEIDDEYWPKTMECMRKIAIPECSGVKCMHLNNDQDKLAVGLDGNSQPIVLDAETGAFVMESDSFNQASQAIRDIQWHDRNTIAIVSHSGVLQCFDTRSSQMIYSAVDPFRSTLYCVRTDGQAAILVGSSEYCRCVLFDNRIASRHKQVYFTQKKSSPVYCLDFDSTKLVAAADRGIAALEFDVSVHNTYAKDYSETFEVYA